MITEQLRRLAAFYRERFERGGGEMFSGHKSAWLEAFQAIDENEPWRLLLVLDAAFDSACIEAKRVIVSAWRAMDISAGGF